MDHNWYDPSDPERDSDGFQKGHPKPKNKNDGGCLRALFGFMLSLSTFIVGWFK